MSKQRYQVSLQYDRPVSDKSYPLQDEPEIIPQDIQGEFFPLTTPEITSD